MSTEKLSELSKPVAYDYRIAGACIAYGAGKKWVDWGNKITHECPPDWMVEEGKVTEIKPIYSQEYVSALQTRIAELEAKLDTPVRLPTAMFCPEEYIGSLLWSETESYNKAISKCAEALRAAGFTVEGDDA